MHPAVLTMPVCCLLGRRHSTVQHAAGLLTQRPLAASARIVSGQLPHLDTAAIIGPHCQQVQQRALARARGPKQCMHLPWSRMAIHTLWT